jgi:hypothetical protein
MMPERLTPGVQHGQEAEFRAKVFGIASNGKQRFGSRAEEQVVDDALVLQCQHCELFRQREDDMKVGHR